jgi:DNA polymerase-4
MRKIIHVDMDAFYASIEQRDHPEWAGRPIAVGGSSERGVVMTASYEARPYGVRSAMPAVQAKRLCPDLLFVSPRMDVYKTEGYRIRDIFHTYTDLVEPLSLDEAYLDVTEPKHGPPSATLLATRILDDIRETTGLSASAGAASSKFVAKAASDWDKPEGLTVVPPGEALAFIAALPIEAFPGVGNVTAEAMHRLGIRTGADLQRYDRDHLVDHFGKRGRFFYRLAQADDNRPVRTDRTRKSVGAERTFSENLTDMPDMVEAVEGLAERVARRLKRAGARGRTVTLKLKFADFEVRTWSETRPRSLACPDDIVRVATYLLRRRARTRRPVRLLGISVHKLQFQDDGAGYQLRLPFDRRHYPL